MTCIDCGEAEASIIHTEAPGCEPDVQLEVCFECLELRLEQSEMQLISGKLDSMRTQILDALPRWLRPGARAVIDWPAARSRLERAWIRFRLGVWRFFHGD